ncbi:MAG: ribonuclease P protein component [Thermoanaerobaculia bacterium]
MNPGPAARETFFRGDRLRKRREFEECYASGVRVSGRHLQLFLLSRQAAGPARFGLSVSRRLGGAVTRNRLRRRLREIFRRNREVFGSAPFDCVVNLRASAVGVAFSELEQDCLSAVRRAVEKIRKPR